MALKTLMLRRSIEKKTHELDELRAKDEQFKTREAELEQSINEAQTPEEETAVAEAVTQFETDHQAHESAKATLEGEIADLQRELDEAEANAPKPNTPNHPNNERKNETMENRTKFYDMTMQERDTFFAREDVKTFLGEIRTCIREKRAINNTGLLIPEVALNLLKQKVAKTSKLIAHVNLRHVSGTARQRIMGEIPEAIWTEACAKLNELTLGFNDTEVDGFKVGGFFAVCNAILEDNDVNLMSEILDALGTAIGKAIDKAIVYGTGVKMPLGIVTRLAQKAKPSDYSATAREWKDLTSHVITGTGATGLNLFKEIVKNSAVAINDYFDGGLCWLMNSKTHNTLKVESMEKNLNAALVAGIGNTMPVAGGDIIELSFIPDGEIVFGYLDAYLLAERAGTVLGQSEHVRFIEDQTVFKGTARYDGEPVIPEAFGVMNIAAKAPTTTMTFAADAANTSAG